MEKYLYSVVEAAHLCGVSRMTINRWIRSGKIKAEKVGRTSVIPLSELAKCMPEMPTDKREEIQKAVQEVVKEYGETLRLLGRE